MSLKQELVRDAFTQLSMKMPAVPRKVLRAEARKIAKEWLKKIRSGELRND